MHCSVADQPLRAGALLLEPITAGHAGPLFPLLQAAELYTFIPHDAPTSTEELAARYARWEERGSRDGSETWLNYAIYRPAKGDFLGTVQATVHVSGEVQIAYEVFPHEWRRHHARTACIALIGHVFASFPRVEEVTALLDTRNEASWRLLESIGFARTGTMVGADWFKGRSSDEYAYAITRAEFAARHLPPP